MYRQACLLKIIKSKFLVFINFREDSEEESCDVSDWQDTNERPRYTYKRTRRKVNFKLPKNEKDRTPAFFLSLYWGGEVFEILVEETNKNYRQKNGQRSNATGKSKWQDVTKEELKKFFGLVIAMGLVRKPQISDYWEVCALTGTPGFGKVSISTKCID